jgi:hypothetical protein
VSLAAGAGDQERAGAHPSEALEPGAIKLWDSPGTLPKNNTRVSWKQDAFFISTGGQAFKRHGQDIRCRDFVVRLALRMNRDARWVSVKFRVNGIAGASSEYALLVDPSSGVIELNVLANGPRKKLKTWPFSRPYHEDEWMRVELRAVGDQFTVSIDGKPLDTIRDTSVSGPGLIYLDCVANSYFRDIVYVPLDHAESTSTPARQPVPVETFAGHRYQIILDRASWSNAKAKAEALGGHLATITSPAEHDWIQKTFAGPFTNPKVWFWLGGYAPAKDEWSLVTGESVALVPWASGHPGYRGAIGYPAAMGFQWGEKGNRITAQGAQYPMAFLVEWDDDGATKPAPAAAVLSPSAEPWRDAFQDPGFTDAGTISENGWILPGRQKFYDLTAGPKRDGAVRALVSRDSLPRVILRVRATSFGQYQLRGTTGSTVTLDIWDQTKSRSTQLKTFPKPDSEQVEMELRVVGSTITVKLNGAVAGEVEDTTWSEGMFGMGTLGDAPTTVQAVEYLNLEGPASPSTAAATKDAPFVNTIGMKFVPVPITNGPTDKQRVLFSIWETRVRDYSPFIDQTHRPWPRSNRPNEGPDHPAIDVSWNDAQAFCAWLTEQEQRAGRIGPSERYRLPSDHEWSCAVGIGEREYHAQSPQLKNGKLEKVYPWGEQWPPPVGVGNLTGEEMQPDFDAKTFPWLKSPIAGYRDTFTRTSPVGSFPAEANGLYDLSGNVREWCEDPFQPVADGRVIRGGSWSQSDEFNLRSSSRNGRALGGYEPSVGFRVVLAPTP